LASPGSVVGRKDLLAIRLGAIGRNVFIEIVAEPSPDRAALILPAVLAPFMVVTYPITPAVAHVRRCLGREIDIRS
jgi:hypothetical protein